MQGYGIVYSHLILGGHDDLAMDLAEKTGTYRQYLRTYYACLPYQNPISADYRAIAAAAEEVEKLDEGFFSKLARTLKTGVKRILGLFKIPQVVQAIKEVLGEISVKGFLDLIAKGKALAKKIGRVLVDKIPFIIRDHDIPTLTSLIEKTELGLKAKGFYKAHLESPVDAIDKWLKRYLPTLSRVAMAAIFAYIWFNVAELSWNPSDLIAGFTGAMTLHQMIASLPESAAGLLVSFISGSIGYTIMPYILIPRLLWLLSKKVIRWHRGKFEVDPEAVPEAA